MILSKRERNIAILTGACVVGLALYFLVYTPYSTWRDGMDRQRIDQNSEQADADRVFHKQKVMRKIEMEMRAGGMQDDNLEAEARARNQITEWAGRNNVEIDSVTHALPVDVNKVSVAGFALDGRGSTSTIAKLLWAVESAPFPVRVQSVDLNPDEGTDHLTFGLNVTTLSPDSNGEIK